MLKRIILFISLLYISSCHADINTDSWRINKEYQNAVIWDKSQSLVAELYISNAQEVYISFLNEQQIFIHGTCKNDESGIAPSIYINEKLVKFLKVCSNYVDADKHKSYFVPFTYPGKEYVIEQFKRSTNVIIKPTGGTNEFIFSTKGFTSAYNYLRNHRGSFSGI